MIGEGVVARTGPVAVGGLFAERYEVERVVGSGGMGTVYRARDRMVGDTVALKILDASVVGSADQLAWFRREVRLARRITHPNVARTHDMGEAGGSHYITMEFVAGGTLQDRMQLEAGARRVLPPVEAAQVALAVCEGLAAAHAAGVVHRDLKPANVLIEDGGRVVLTDFGIARGLGDGDAARTQGIVGTPQYMAPEQLSGQPVDVRADIYALGLMLFEMLTAEVPFPGDTIFASALARMTRPPPDPRALRPDLPPALAELVLHCLAQKPDDRPAAAREVAERLREWLAAASPSSLTLAPGPTTLTMTPGPPTTQPMPAIAAAAPPSERALAVLPFRYQGPPDQGYLGDALADELIDVLSRTRGLRVLGSGAAAKYRTDRDPRAVGADLGVTAVVDATVQATPKQVRVLARLVEVASGTQMWSDRFEAGIEDLFELQDRMSKQIAEALRVELGTAASVGHVPAEAVALYLRGRRKLLAGQILGQGNALELLEQCLRLAPGLQPALAYRAIACLRAWFLPGAFTGDDVRDWASEARTAVARARELAPDLAETHLARAMLAVQHGEWKEAVQALGQALEIAPTYAHAQQYLAHLQCEAGQTREGCERARTAFALDPSLRVALMDVARVHALHGEREQAEQLLRDIERNAPFRGPIVQSRARIAAYYGDVEAVREIAETLEDEASGGMLASIAVFCRGLAGDGSSAEVVAYIERLVQDARNPRFLAMAFQFATEIHAARGETKAALEWFLRATDGAMIDLEWIDRCPLLKDLRSLPGFAEGRRKVRRRVQAMWSL
ncbi:MAG: protein kinase [Myxococcales bacterium]|nr:protein kinase [Myxococcales bacterium]